jgi:hypothetical protein
MPTLPRGALPDQNVRRWKVCRMHGARDGAPEGKRNGNYRHGGRTKEMIEAWKLHKIIALMLGESFQAFEERLAKAAADANLRLPTSPRMARAGLFSDLEERYSSSASVSERWLSRTSCRSWPISRRRRPLAS